MAPASRRARFPWPALVLFFLSPVVGELLSSASPPIEFFSVFGLTVMSVLYGSGALLVRDLVRTFSWTAANQWALASGALAFFIAFSQLVELDRNRTDDPRGMRIVDLVAAALLLAGYLKVRREEANRPASG